MLSACRFAKLASQVYIFFLHVRGVTRPVLGCVAVPRERGGWLFKVIRLFLILRSAMEGSTSRGRRVKHQIRKALNATEQCDLLAGHGVKFEICTKEQAEKFLQNNTYFFKIKAFDNNFYRDKDGHYSNLDFAYLQDLSTIDFEFRALILRMTGDIEHALRIRFNNLISRVNEDGYQVVRDYEYDQKEIYRKRSLQEFDPNNDYRNSVYTRGMIDKYLDQKPIWLFWETCSLNSLINCYNSFLQHRKFQDITYPLLYGVRLLRNAASHHNCLFIPPSSTINNTRTLDNLMPILLSQRSRIRENTLQLIKSDPLIHDFSCVILSHINLVMSTGMRHYIVSSAETFLERIQRHSEWYQNPKSGCTHLVKQFDAIKLILSEYISFIKKLDINELSDEQQKLIHQPKRKPVRHGPRLPSPRTRKRQKGGKQH